MSASYPDPLIFLGYVVTDPHAARRKLLLFASDAHEQAEPPLPTAAPYDIMVRDGRVHDIDKDDLDRWCEYIFYRGLYRTAYARISRGSITDTELQVGQFAVPRYGKTTGEVSEADRYLRAQREELPIEHVRTSPPSVLTLPRSSCQLPVPCYTNGSLSYLVARSHSGSLMHTMATNITAASEVISIMSLIRYVAVSMISPVLTSGWVN